MTTCFLQIPGLKIANVISQNSKSARTATHYDPLSRRITDLKRERAKLEEEVLQLRAAVRIWTAVCQQTRAVAAGAQFSGRIQ